MRVWQMTLTEADLVAACDGARAVTTWRERRADRKALPLIVVAGPPDLLFGRATLRSTSPREVTGRRRSD
ncbi:hypothetical protein ACFOKI_01460 [Sphingomonas qilianensis]|uniref:Uncharacterized protein n=1 Tax=Sphingomonas qilianensis TaxID=1736690 RepID=A0ABU9XSB7_9SPHN